MGKACGAGTLTPLARGQVLTPGEVPLAHEDAGAHHLVARVALVGDDGAMHQLRLRRALPAIGDLR